MNYPQSIFVILFVVFALAFCFHAGAQTETSKSAVLIDSFGRGPNGDFKGRADYFMSELTNRPESHGLIIIYGPPREVEARKRLCVNHFTFRRFPVSRLSYKVGGNVSEFRTDFWLIPTGAAPPEIKPEAWIAGEFGRAYKKDAMKTIDGFFAELRNLDNHQAYIISYGTPSEIALRERWIRDSIVFRRFDGPRITLVNGGTGPVRTVMWLVPPSAANPTP